MQTNEFKKGDRVLYVPHHAKGDTKHKDCQKGIVSSTNTTWVFVKYDTQFYTMLTGDEPFTAQATAPTDLIKLPKGVF